MTQNNRNLNDEMMSGYHSEKGENLKNQMSRVIILICIALVGGCFHLSAVFAQFDENAISKITDDLMSDAYNKHLFSGVVAISHNDKLIYLNEIGFSNWETKTVVTKNTLFNIGSINKKITEEMIRQLVDEKKLFYEDRLDKYLDLYSDEMAKKITICQLLDMRAGLGDFLQNPFYRQDLSLRDFTLSELMELIKNEPLLYEPGTREQYSNSGYVVLGAVIEKITEKSYEENLKERIIDPLGLTNVFYTRADILKQTDQAFPTDVDFEGNKMNVQEVIANSTPAGGMYMDAGNLLKFAEMLLRNPVPAASQRPGMPPMFAGGSPGWSSVIFYNSKDGYAIAVLSNIGDNSAVEIARRLNSAIHNAPYPPFSLPVAMMLYPLIQEKGYTYIKENFKEITASQRIPDNDIFLIHAAGIFTRINQIEIAINLYKINIELFPGSVFTYDALSQAYLRKGEKNEALLCLKKVLDFEPDNQRIRKLIEDLENEKM